MGIKKIALVAAIGLSMASAPVMAQTAPVSRSAPVLAEANAQDEGYGGTSTYIVAFFVIVAIGLGLYFALNDDDEGRTSP